MNSQNKIDEKETQAVGLKDLSILYVEDDHFLREKVMDFLKMRFNKVDEAVNGKDGLTRFYELKPDIVITDIKMPVMDGLEMSKRIKLTNPETPILILTAFSETDSLMKAIEIGVDRYVRKPVEGENLMEMIAKCALPILQKREIMKLDHKLQSSLESLLGNSSATREIIKQIQQVAFSNFSVIVQGETGVGKTLIAHTIHNLSKRAKKSFVVVDIGSLPDTLVESELFGHKKGAFTGADTDKKGFFEAARGGTIFLDELENISLYVQSKLLHAVEEKKIYPLGSTVPVHIDVRIIGASNKELFTEVIEKRFRQDLYYRLCEFNIQVPPLRERTEDILMLAKRFYADAVDELEKPVKEFEKEAIQLLKQHRWEGNVRELKNTMRRVALVCEKKKVTMDDVLNIINATLPTSNLQPGGTGIPVGPLSEVEKWAVANALSLTKGKKLKAAALLHIDYKTLMAKIKKYNL